MAAILTQSLGSMLIVVIVAVLILARAFGLGQLQDWIETLGI